MWLVHLSLPATALSLHFSTGSLWREQIGLDQWEYVSSGIFMIYKHSSINIYILTDISDRSVTQKQKSHLVYERWWEMDETQGIFTMFLSLCGNVTNLNTCNLLCLLPASISASCVKILLPLMLYVKFSQLLLCFIKITVFWKCMGLGL